MFIIGIGFYDNGDQEVPQSALTNWRAREASLIIQSESKGLRTRAADGINCSPRSKALELGGHLV